MASLSMNEPDTGAILREALRAAQSGDPGRARSIAEAGLVRGGDPAALNAFLGMIHARMGDPRGAIAHLRAAHAHRPDDITIACNLIAALIETGASEDVLAIATRERALADASLRLARYRGFVAQTLERFDEAVEAYEHVVERSPGDFESWNNLGNARSATGDLAGAVAALERAVELDPQAPPTRLNLAEALRAAGRAEEAEAVLRRAAADFPDDPRPLMDLYVQFKLDWRQDDVLPVLEAAAARDADNPDLQLKLGVEYGFAHRIPESRAAFDRAIALDPLLTDAYLGLAIQYEHTNREDLFAPLIERAEANGVAEGALAFLRALEHRRAKRFEEGLASLALVPADIEPQRSVHIRATLLDRLGRTDEAFSAFAEANRLHQENPSEPLRRAEELRSELEGELRIMTPAWRAGWSADAPTGLRDPVFLVGFPRSGTTLLDTILMGHPGTTVLEEEPPLYDAERAIGGTAALPSLDPVQLDAGRARYFEEVGGIVDHDPARLLVDKSPLFLNKVPVIHRLFPNARFILALRHPCDVLLSCFMSNFRLNNAMANFLRLEDAAAFYDLTFHHWERARSLFPIRVHTIVYERLVEDVEAEVRPLFDFLELDWRPEALEHTRTAKARGLITTASYSQVTEPIYRRAAGRWMRYRSHLEPVLPTLAPWVEKFGYSL
ncbi:tetratricopeptide repeat-containing sulfotransferase family protein [Sphingomonas sp.]|uniref:tetratricopeptide repeat-containing sulfotransferase family protein n=1 Tax=Sphingomonas sp. TaxID=28214 RepID=UPI001B2752CF|nr:tetratricopeptide repeat-containing sulfotransferase family protein [Sphingomonas sp.]MBO9713131.1 sulfotransferase [Sphingomonas sp.]